MTKKITPCTEIGCPSAGEFALYELLVNKTKRWRTDLCILHWEKIFDRNTEIKRLFPPGQVFTDPELCLVLDALKKVKSNRGEVIGGDVNTHKQ